jgi:hypothetical protein
VISPSQHKVVMELVSLNQGEHQACGTISEVLVVHTWWPQWVVPAQWFENRDRVKLEAKGDARERLSLDCLSKVHVVLLHHIKVVLGSSIRQFKVEPWGQWDGRHPC